MQQSDAKAAILSRLQAYVAANPGPTALTIYAPNTATETPGDGSVFLQLQFPIAREEQITLGAIGSNVFRFTSSARFVLEIPIGNGLAGWDVWLDGLRANLRSVQFGGVQTLAPSGILDDDHNGDGPYYAMAFVLEFYADLIA